MVRKKRVYIKPTGNEQYTYGLSHTLFYHAWRNMYRRCLDKNNPTYKYYGGRGIKVCERWYEFANFIEDMYELYEYHVENFGGGRKNCQLDRMDNDGDYNRDNCRWVTAKVNCNNRRKYLTGVERMVTHKGKTQCMRKWALELNLPYSMIRYRVYNNLPLEK